jgi:hypothetical protein
MIFDEDTVAQLDKIIPRLNQLQQSIEDTKSDIFPEIQNPMSKNGAMEILEPKVTRLLGQFRALKNRLSQNV